MNLLEATPARYELALALAGLGAHLRRTGRPGEARAPLRRALDLAQRCGAAPLADQARQELLATGARPRRTALTGPDALTSAERRVAALAAAGMSNRQIAQHLFITLPTVETHLRHAFGKLGITSRAGLPAQLASQARPASLPDEPALAVTGLPVPDGRTGSKVLDEGTKRCRCRTGDFWQYALFAAVAHIRAAANRAGMPIRAGLPGPRPIPCHPAP